MLVYDWTEIVIPKHREVYTMKCPIYLLILLVIFFYPFYFLRISIVEILVNELIMRSK